MPFLASISHGILAITDKEAKLVFAEKSKFCFLKTVVKFVLISYPLNNSKMLLFCFLDIKILNRRQFPTI